MDRQVRRSRIEPANPRLCVGTQRRLPSISRSSYYHEPQGENVANLGLMRNIDTQFLETPFFGAQQ